MRSEVFSMTWRAALVALVLLVLGVPAYTQVGGAVGGVPSRLRVTSLGVGAAPPTGSGTIKASGAALGGLLLEDRSADADEKLWRLYSSSGAFGVQTRTDADGAGGNPITITRSGTTVSGMSLAATGIALSGATVTLGTVAVVEGAASTQSNLYLQHDGNASTGVRMLSDSDDAAYLVNSENALFGFGANNDFDQFTLAASGAISSNGVDMTPTSGTFTIDYANGCSTTPTQAARYYKIGALVTITVAAAFSCTADTTVFDSDTNVPAAIRPISSNVYGPHVGANNNGTSVTAMVEIATNGEVIVNRCGAVTGTCDGGAWTGSGNRGLDAWTVSYVIQ